MKTALPLLLAAALSAGPLAAQAPAPLGFPDTLATLDAFAKGAMAEQNVPGMAFAVVKDDQVVLTRAYGVKKLGDPAPVTEHTAFEVGSTTKAFTAGLLGALVDEGKVSWDDRVVDLLPDFRVNDPWVTREARLADLLCQRSGMPPYSLDLMSFIGFDREQIVRALAAVEPVTSFRSTFGYINTFWLVAAQVIEKEEGVRWEDAMNLRFLGPLGMRESTVDPEVVAMLPDLATGHLAIPGSGSPWEKATPIPAGWLYANWLNVYGPAGNLRSTVGDMARWARMHLNGGVLDGTRVLAADTVETLHAPRTFVGATGGVVRSYASGWVREEHPASTVVWHNGSSSGMHSIVALYPEAKVALVVLTNYVGNKVPEEMKDKLFDLLYPAPSSTASLRAAAPAWDPEARPLAQRARAARPLAPVPPLPLARYAGSYENPAYGRFTVKEKDGGLVMEMGPAAIPGALAHWSGNVFTLTWPQFPGLESYVTFSVPQGQPADKFTAPIFAESAKGVFTRAH